MTNSAPDLVYTAEVAQMLHQSTRTVHRLVQSGKLQPVAVGPGKRGAMVFNRADIEALRSAALAEQAS